MENNYKNSAGRKVVDVSEIIFNELNLTAHCHHMAKFVYPEEIFRLSRVH
ncbi:hypothetical protein [Rickettsiella massiliensis]|nr:hypothetical protein [Rickettsiella massiliensis]